MRMEKYCLLTYNKKNHTTKSSGTQRVIEIEWSPVCHSHMNTSYRWRLCVDSDSLYYHYIIVCQIIIVAWRYTNVIWYSVYSVHISNEAKPIKQCVKDWTTIESTHNEREREREQGKHNKKLDLTAFVVGGMAIGITYNAFLSLFYFQFFGMYTILV